jgi:hypothetical protein
MISKPIFTSSYYSSDEKCFLMKNNPSNLTKPCFNQYFQVCFYALKRVMENLYSINHEYLEFIFNIHVYQDFLCA